MISTKGKSLQEVVDEIGKKLGEQLTVCMVDGLCRYSDEKGNHCAIGWLLNPNEDFSFVTGGVEPLLELHEVGAVDIGENYEFIDTHSDALELIQNLHDCHLDSLAFSWAEEDLKERNINLDAWDKWFDFKSKIA